MTQEKQPDALAANRNWTEDASHENGNYECICAACGQHFTGHKRRVVCKACSTSSATPAMTAPEDCPNRESCGWYHVSTEPDIGLYMCSTPGCPYMAFALSDTPTEGQDG